MRLLVNESKVKGRWSFIARYLYEMRRKEWKNRFTRLCVCRSVRYRHYYDLYCNALACLFNSCCLFQLFATHRWLYSKLRSNVPLKANNWTNNNKQRKWVSVCWKIIVDSSWSWEYRQTWNWLFLRYRWFIHAFFNVICIGDVCCYSGILGN